jgi:hypothetical protein
MFVARRIPVGGHGRCAATNDGQKNLLLAVAQVRAATRAPASESATAHYRQPNATSSTISTSPFATARTNAGRRHPGNDRR